MKDSTEITASAGIDQSQEMKVHTEDDSEKDVDQMWAEALSGHADAKASEEKLLDSKDNTGGSPGASS